jgi:hypothetical protein
MTRVIVDDTLRSKLHDLRVPLELCDGTGLVLARVVPILDPSKYTLEPQISQEEVRRRRQSDEPRYTTAEVLAHLEKQ